MDEKTLEDYWEPSFDALYDACFYELASDQIILTWYWIDLAVSLLTAVTVLASALFGWVLWAIPSGKIVWGCITAAAFLLVIMHRALGVPSRIRKEGERRQVFSMLRAQLQTFRTSLPSGINVSNANKRFDALREQLSSCMAETPQDVVFTQAARRAVQASVNEKLARFIHA